MCDLPWISKAKKSVFSKFSIRQKTVEKSTITSIFNGFQNKKIVTGF